VVASVFLALLATGAAPAAAAPKLIPVDTGKSPLKLSAPVGWGFYIYAPHEKVLSTFAAISPQCLPGPDISVTIQLDQQIKSPEALIADQYPKTKYPETKPTKIHGWLCVAEEAHTDAMCAGRVKGLQGVVNVYFATTELAPYKALGAGAFAAKVAASLKWAGGDPNRIDPLDLSARPEGKDLCTH